MESSENVMINQAAETVINYGIAGVVILAFFLATMWLGKRLFGPQGLLVKLADQHMDFVIHLRNTQDGIKQAIECSNEIQQQIVMLNEESIQRLETIKRGNKSDELITIGERYLRILRTLSERLEVDSGDDLRAIENSFDELKRRGRHV